MGSARVLLATLLLSSACAEVETIESTSAPIVNGEIDEGDPATVFLWLGGGSCTGTLVSPKVVLTAKHCLGGSTSSMEAFFGTYSSGGSGTWIDVVHQASHPSTDVGMVTLAEAGPATPIPMNPRDLAPHIGADVRVAGFGVTSESGGGSGTKRWGMSTLDSVDGDVMYANNVPSGTCYGDSGGPNFMTFEGVEYVVGVTSFGTAACGSGLDGSIRTDPHIDWFEDYIAAHDDPASCAGDGRCASGCDQVDPDCPCADDGFCTADCPDLASDGDCTGCDADGTCRADCPALDTDCCAADGSCTAECGMSDPDCAAPPPPPPGGDDDGDDGDDGDGGDGTGGAPDGTVAGGCRVGGDTGAAAWLLTLGLLGIRRRRS